MTKKKNRFVQGMVIYALVFLLIAGAGLTVFWKYIDAYERSRPKNTMDQYLAELTVQDMVDHCGEWKNAIDSNLQSWEESAAIIRQSVPGKVTYARKGDLCTETSQTYVLRCGAQVIGQVVIEAEEPDLFGFTVWSVTEESFDFTHLLGGEQSITVPSVYTVCANGTALDGSYITESGIPYDALEEFYDDYDLPSMVTYTAGHILGDVELTVLDQEGNLISDWENADPSAVLDNCTAEEEQWLNQFLEGFLVSYVRFTGSSNQAASLNYAKLRSGYLIPDSDLAKRLATALDGLAFAQSYGDKLDEVIVHRLSRIDDDHYFCDVTYLVSTYGKAGKVQTTNNMKLMLTIWEGTLRVESMTRY